MEGYMDVFRAASVDIKNVVAIMGTALTIEQTNLIKKLSNNVYLCLDGDAPGQKAMLSIGEELEKNGLNVKIITLTNNEDPDTYILKYGKEGFEEQIEKAISFSDFKLQSLKKGVKLKFYTLFFYINDFIRISFLSIISSILLIYSDTSFTLKALSILSPETSFVEPPAPSAIIL